MNKPIDNSSIKVLGKTEIRYGKHERNHIIYFENHGMISIDFDSDFSLWLKINVSNPRKQWFKAQKIASKIPPSTTVEDLVEIGFEHNIPEKYFK